MLFGDKGSPDLAAFAIKLLAEMNKDQYPTGASVLPSSTYVDDVTHSEPDSNDANNAITEVDAVLGFGKFNIKHWNSNSDLVNQNQEEAIDILGHQ